MTDRNHKLSLSRQAELLGISRGSLYYEPRPTSDADLKLMRRIDELHMEYPFAGSRMMKGLLRQEGFTAGRLHVATCMKIMGIEALYRRPNTSKPAPGRKIYPYLLRKLAVTRPNQVRAMDITYIPMARGFVYLVAVLDWFSRKVLAWRLSVSLETAPCLEALNETIRRFGKPEIMNSDQGSQFTSFDFIKALKNADIQISMDGKGAWRDNVFVGRLWRSIKYEEVHLRAYNSVSVARDSLARYLTFYNTRRPHSSLDGQTPDQAYHIKPREAHTRREKRLSRPRSSARGASIPSPSPIGLCRSAMVYGTSSRQKISGWNFWVSAVAGRQTCCRRRMPESLPIWRPAWNCLMT